MDKFSFGSINLRLNKRYALLFALVMAVALAFSAALVGAKAEARGATAASWLRPNAGGVPRPDHVVLVIEENHSYSEIIGSSAAPYINGLAQQGALFTNSHGVEHPSQPNYLDMFSGSNQGITNDSCPHTFSAQNLGSELIGAGLTFAGYSEDLPAPGSTVCSYGAYARKHNPWVNFTNVPSSANLPFTSFPSSYSTLPAISVVVPNLYNDMHDGTIQQGDTWLQQRIDAYRQWAQTHNSLLIITWDEDDFSSSNRIATIFVGPMVVTGQYSESINHYNLLRTLEDMYDLPYAGQSGNVSPIADVWTSGSTATATPTSLPTSTNSSTVTITATPSETPTDIITYTATATAVPPTYTDTPTPADTATNTPIAQADLIAHVVWQARLTQPSPLQILPITLTLKSEVTEINYPSQTTDVDGFFTVSVGSLPPGEYSYRVKGPKYLANAGIVQLNVGRLVGQRLKVGRLKVEGYERESLMGATASSQPSIFNLQSSTFNPQPSTSVEMGLLRAGDCNNDNRVNIADFNILRLTFDKSIGEPGYDDRADFTGDDAVNIADFNPLKSNYGHSGAPPLRPGAP